MGWGAGGWGLGGLGLIDLSEHCKVYHTLLLRPVPGPGPEPEAAANKRSRRTTSQAFRGFEPLASARIAASAPLWLRRNGVNKNSKLFKKDSDSCLQGIQTPSLSPSRRQCAAMAKLQWLGISIKCLLYGLCWLGL